MATQWTTAQLLPRVRTAAALPPADARFPDAVLLSIGDECLRTVLPSLLKNAGGDLLVRTASDVPLVAGQETYPIPERALAGSLEEVAMVDSAGNLYDANFVPAGDRSRSFTSPFWRSSRWAFGIEGVRIRVYPTPAAGVSDLLRVSYQRRPSRLVLTTAAAQIASIAGSVITTVATVPASWSSTEPLDATEGDRHRASIADAMATSSVSGTNVTLTSSPPDGLRVGDWLSLVEESPLPQIPEALNPALIWAIALEVRASKKDREGMALAKDRLAQAVSDAENLLQPRIEHEQPPAINWDSALRHGRHFTGWRR